MIFTDRTWTRVLIASHLISGCLNDLAEPLAIFYANVSSAAETLKTLMRIMHNNNNNGYF